MLSTSFVSKLKLSIDFDKLEQLLRHEMSVSLETCAFSWLDTVSTIIFCDFIL